MKEGDARAADADPRRLVDQAQAGGLQRGQMDRIMEGVPRLERRRPAPDLRVAAAEKPSQTAD